MIRPTVSIILPIRGNGAYLETSLRSLIEQERPADQLVIIDDGMGSRRPGTAWRSCVATFRHWWRLPAAEAGCGAESRSCPSEWRHHCLHRR